MAKKPERRERERGREKRTYGHSDRGEMKNGACTIDKEEEEEEGTKHIHGLPYVLPRAKMSKRA